MTEGEAPRAPTSPSAGTVREPEEVPAPGVHSLDLPCPTCGEVLRHRVLHVRGSAPPSSPKAKRTPLEGVARCLRCRTTHPFTLTPRLLSTVTVIVSDGPRSRRTSISWPPERRIDGETTLRLFGRPVRVARIEVAEQRSAASALPSEIVALWTVPTDVVHLNVSLREGARTLPLHYSVKADVPLRVGGTFRVEGEPFEIVGLRGRGRTFHEPGEELPAREVQRVYARRAERPPGGRRAWTSSRVIPRS